MKFTPNGGRVFVSPRLVNGNIEVRVSDTGPGIPEENLATIFDRFQQASISGSSEIKGTGLGLAIVVDGILPRKISAAIARHSSIQNENEIVKELDSVKISNEYAINIDVHTSFKNSLK